MACRFKYTHSIIKHLCKSLSPNGDGRGCNHLYLVIVLKKSCMYCKLLQECHNLILLCKLKSTNFSSELLKLIVVYFLYEEIH